MNSISRQGTLPLVLSMVMGSAAAIAVEPIEEVSVTAYRTPVLQSEIIGNHAAISAETLGIMGATHIQQSLARVPGVNLQHNSGQEYLPAVRSPVLAGAGACGSFLMAEDGIPLRPAGFCNVNELFEAHSEQAERIEVIRGPGVALYGSNALHGVINVITPAATDAEDSLGVEYSSEDFYRVQHRSSFDNLTLAFTGSSDAGYRDDAGVDQQKLSVRGEHDFDHVEMTAGATLINLNQETAGYITGHNAYQDADVARSNPNPEAYRDAQALRLWTRLTDQSESPSWVITPYARSSEMDFIMHFLPGTPLEKNGQDSVGVQSAFYRTSGNSRWVMGVDGEVVDGWLKQYQARPTPGSPLLRETIPVGYQYDYGVTGVQLAPYVQWDQALSQRWDLSVGTRLEWMQYDYDNHMLDGRTRDDGTACGFGGCRYSRPADSTDDFTNFSPKLGLSYTPAEGQRIYLSLASGFRAPQAVELYRLQRDQVVADLDSEQLDSIELGYQGQLDRLDLEVLIYGMKKRNMIFRDSDFFNVSAGKTRHAGVEVAATYQLTEAFSVVASATEARHKYDYDDVLSGSNINGNDVDGAPHHFSNLVLRWSPADTAVVELEWLHMGSYYLDAENEHQYSGHDLLNLLSQIDLSPNIQLNARVINLADEEYADRADYTTFTGDRYLPGSPRTVFVGVKYNW